MDGAVLIVHLHLIWARDVIFIFFPAESELSREGGRGQQQGGN
jgi:hypothetical protein